MSSDESEDFVYGHILEAITGGLYPNKLDIVREYLQNSYDAIREYVNAAENDSEREERIEGCKITVSIQGRSLIIHDNGIGMDRQTINEYRKIGFSRKPFGEYAGWRGIGKAAGLAIAEKLIVLTSKGNGESYQLTFNAADMMRMVYEYRSRGENIPFNHLIMKYSNIDIIPEGDEPYTTVELHNISTDADELLDKNRMASHLAVIAPAPFHPEFKYGEVISQHLHEHIDDYVPINLWLDDIQIFKPYFSEWTEPGKEEPIKIDPPEFLPVYDEEEELIAYCWYCMHSDRGQIKDKIRLFETDITVGGIVYRCHDIRIGDPNLTRRTLWLTTPERSLWALGEIHVIDDSVEPTSDRNNFIDNHARYRLYQKSRIIAKEISRKAGSLSARSKAAEKITGADKRIKEINEEINKKRIPRSVVPAYIYEATALKKEAEKRKPKTPLEELKEVADSVISTADKIVEKLTRSIKEPTPENVVHSDIIEDLKIGEEGRLVYESIMSVLNNYFSNEPRQFQDIVRRITSAIEERMTG